MLALIAFVVMLGAAWLAFVFGRATADRRTNLNHHKMMVLLVDLRSADDTVPIMPTLTREKLDRLLTEYEHLDLDEVHG